MVRNCAPENLEIPDSMLYASLRDDGHAIVSSLKLLAKREDRHIGRTSTTSGTKCFSRFWMPCCSVAVEDGQPAQEPFMLR